MITIENKDSNIYVFGRDSNNKSYVKEITTFVPYFYYEGKSGEFSTIDNKKVSKLICKYPKNIFNLKNNYNHYEADINYLNRFLIDTYFNKEIEKENIRKCYIDIETDMQYELDIEKTKNAILSITCYDNFTNKYFNFAVKKDKIFRKDNISYYWFKDETDMLKKFISFIKTHDFDVILGFNSDNFDIPYIINRTELLKVNINNLGRLRENSYSVCRDKEFSNKIFGRVCLDVLKMYKKISQNKEESYSLNYIAKKILGKEKDKYEGTLIDLYNNDFEKYIKYNIKDVELIVELDEKLKLIEYFDEIRRYAKCRFEDVYENSKVVDNMILCEARKENIILPSRKYISELSTYEGGFVYQPTKGLFENVAVLDMASLYPSIMYSFNISYETYGIKNINIDNNFFYSNKIGLIPKIIKNLLKERKKYKNLMKQFNKESIEYSTYDLQQYAIKIINNSIYGVMGFSGFRLYNRNIAESITYIARKIIHEAVRIAEINGFKTCYGDTDSCMLLMGNKSPNEVKELVIKMNNNWDEWIKQFGLESHILQIQFEKVYRTIFFTKAKKRYAGLIKWKDEQEVNIIDIKGFENRRSDYPQIARDFQKELFNKILNKNTKNEIDIFIDNFKNNIKNKYLIEEIALPIGISTELNSYKNLPIHIRAAKLANERHSEDIRKGDKIKYIYVKKCPSKYRFENVIAFKNKMPEGYEIDYNKMIERLVDNKIEDIYDALGWRQNSEKINKSLFDF
jgi:DNA polymerase I